MKNSRNVDTPTRFSLDSNRKMPGAPEHLAPGHRGSIRNSKATSADDVTQWRAIDRKGKAVDKMHRQPSLSTDAIPHFSRMPEGSQEQQAHMDRGSYALDLEREIVKALRLDEEDPSELRKPASLASLRPTSALQGPGNPANASRLPIDNARSTVSTADASSHKSDRFVATQNDGTAHVEHQNSRLTDSTLRALESGTNSKSVSGGQRQILEHQHLDFPGPADQADSSSTALCGATGLKTTNPIRLTLNDGAPLMTPVEEASEQSPGSIHGACNLTNASKCGDCRAEQAPSIRSHRSPGTTTEEQVHDAPVVSNKSSHSAMRPFNESTQSSARDANLPKARDFQTDNIAGSPYAPLGEQSHHRQGSGAPLQLHQMPSVSSLGAQDGSIGRQYYQNLNLAWGLGERNYSAVSLPSDYNSEGHYRSLSDPPRSMDGALAPGHGGASVSEPGSVHGRQSPLRNEAGNSTGTRSSFHDILSQPNSDSVDSTKVNPATSGHDLSDAAAWGPFEQGYSAHKRASAMRKLRMVGKLPQLSRAVPHRRAFSRFSGLFGRTNNAQIPTNPPQPRVFDLQHQHQQSSASALTLQTDRPRSRENRSSEHLPSFRGLPPPPQGYYAPESYDAFIGGHKLTGQRQKIITASNSSIPENSPNTNINNTQNDTMSSRLYSYQPTPSQPIIPYRYSASSLPHTPPSRRESETSRGRSSGRTYAQDLHLRSRSPKNFPPSPEEKTMSSTDLSDPAYHLGIFRSNPRTSRLGDQELPWKITIPGEAEERAAASSSRYGGVGGDYQYGLDMSRPHRGSAPAMPMPLVTEDVVSSSNHPHRGQGRAINSVRSPVELPADDSSEEIVMSSTAYPGQEWRPLGLSEWQY
ncbi:hypothetical protein AWENTII_012496 [Aspergillus wentii]